MRISQLRGGKPDRPSSEDAGKKHAPGRSRNDPGSPRYETFVRDEITEIDALVKEVLVTLEKIMEEKTIHTYMPGFNPSAESTAVNTAHHMGAYFEMFRRDRAALRHLQEMNYCPLVPVRWLERRIRWTALTQQSCSALTADLNRRQFRIRPCTMSLSSQCSFLRL